MYGALDPQTDLARSYFGTRYYASGNGRFTTVDPLLDLRAALGNLHARFRRMLDET